uniref:Uncharacterized protein n=1 Tax=Anopheles merus TaxID=30066 RepID=A0A182UWM3_ANOME
MASYAAVMRLVIKLLPLHWAENAGRRGRVLEQRGGRMSDDRRCRVDVRHDRGRCGILNHRCRMHDRRVHLMDGGVAGGRRCNRLHDRGRRHGILQHGGRSGMDDRYGRRGVLHVRCRSGRHVRQPVIAVVARSGPHGGDQSQEKLPERETIRTEQAGS